MIALILKLFLLAILNFSTGIDPMKLLYAVLLMISVASASSFIRIGLRNHKIGAMRRILNNSFVNLPPSIVNKKRSNIPPKLKSVIIRKSDFDCELGYNGDDKVMKMQDYQDDCVKRIFYEVKFHRYESARQLLKYCNGFDYQTACKLYSTFHGFKQMEQVEEVLNEGDLTKLTRQQYQMLFFYSVLNKKSGANYFFQNKSLMKFDELMLEDARRAAESIIKTDFRSLIDGLSCIF